MSAAALRWFRHRPEGLGETPSYGARELQRLQSQYLLQSLAIACLFGLTVAFVLSQLSHLWREGLLVVVAIPEEEGSVEVLPDPVPPLEPPPAPPAPPAADLGIPVAVPDAAIDTALALPAQPESWRPPFDDAEGPGGSGPVGKSGRESAEPWPDPDEPVFVDEMPILIVRVTPDYPEIARRAGLEGRVTVRALVGVDGHVEDARVQGAPSVFDEEAMRGVRRWVFRPALTNGRPVRVWVSVPITFQLR